MKLLITGGAGFIGSNLASSAIDSGYDVVLMDNLSPQIHGDVPKMPDILTRHEGKYTFIKGDVRQKNDWLKALDGVSIVVHLAAETGTGQSMYQVEKYCDVNITGLAIFLDLVANKKVCIEKIVIASSRALYGEGKYRDKENKIFYPESRSDELLKKGIFDCVSPVDGSPLELMPTDEDSIIHPSSIYGITKSTQEQMVIQTAKSCGISAVALRYQNVYGPGQSLFNPYTGILSIFSNQLLAGLGINIFEDGKESRDFVFIDDVVDATLRAVKTDSGVVEVYNVGSGIAIDVLEVANTLKEIYGSESEIKITGNYRMGDIRHNYACLSKARDQLGFEPQVTFREGIRNFAQWVNKKGPQKSLYEKSIDEMKSRGLLR